MEGQHFSNVREERTNANETVLIQGECCPAMSVRKQPYKIEFRLTERREIEDSRCSCVAGVSGDCKHAAGLFLFVNKERSTGRTDGAQKWGGPPSKKSQVLYPKGETVEELFSLASEGRPKFKMSKGKMSSLAKDLGSCGLQDSALFKSLTAEREEVEEEEVPQAPILPVELWSLFRRNDFLVCKISAAREQFFHDVISCSEEKRDDIFSRTLQQAKTRLWHEERKWRISASKAHKILRARTDSTRLSYFLGHTGFDNTDLQYGRRMEEEAKKKYVQVTGNTLFESGLVIKSCQPWLCATPDAFVKVGEDLCVLEVKCPSSCAEKKIEVPYMDENQNLKKGSPYYTQVQLQMYVCNVEKCHFFVYSSADFVFHLMQKDDAFL